MRKIFFGCLVAFTGMLHAYAEYDPAICKLMRDINIPTLIAQYQEDARVAMVTPEFERRLLIRRGRDVLIDKLKTLAPAFRKKIADSKYAATLEYPNLMPGDAVAKKTGKTFSQDDSMKIGYGFQEFGSDFLADDAEFAGMKKTKPDKARVLFKNSQATKIKTRLEPTGTEIITEIPSESLGLYAGVIQNEALTFPQFIQFQGRIRTTPSDNPYLTEPGVNLFNLTLNVATGEVTTTPVQIFSQGKATDVNLTLEQPKFPTLNEYLKKRLAEKNQAETLAACAASEEFKTLARYVSTENKAKADQPVVTESGVGEKKTSGSNKASKVR